MSGKLMTWCAILVFNIALSLSLSADQEVVFESNTWPGEGIPTFYSEAESLELYHQASLSSPSVNVKVKKDQRLHFSESKILTTESVFFVAHEDLESYCKASGRDRIPKATLVEYLTYRAEGMGFFRVDGEVCLISVLDQAGFQKQENQPKTQWWVNLKREAPSWLLVTDNTQIRLGKREF